MVKKIAHITDLHLEEAFPIDNGVKAKDNWIRILKDVVNRGIEEIVFTGDIGTIVSNKWFFDSVNKYPISLKLTIGNHDLFSETIKYYNPDLPEERRELFYTNEYSYYKYIFLDSSTSKISNTQLDWFKNELKTDKTLILFIHHPILETNTAPQREYPLEGSEKIKEVLLRYKGQVHLFCGHLHMEDEQLEKNISQYITPAACYQIKKQSSKAELDNINFGYRIIEIGNKISSEVIIFNV